MTEDEAKTKACCGPEGCGAYNPENVHITRTFRPDNTSTVSLEGVGPGFQRLCIGSACMAWRIETPERYEEREQQWLDAKEDASVQGGAMNEPFQDKPEGWCGLSGDPRQ